MTAHAAGFSVGNLNHVLVGDASSSTAFAWTTARTASASTPQPVTAIVYAPSAEFSIANSPRVQATAEVSDRVAHHKATLSGLRPGTAYTYAIVNQTTGETSAPSTFTTAPSGTEEFSFIATADANWRSTSSYKNFAGATLEAALASVPDAGFIVHTGDAASSTDATHWDGFFGQAPQTLASTAIVPVSMASGSSNKEFSLDFAVPNTKNETDNFSFTYGGALVLSVNAKLTSTAATNSTAAWIKQEVASKGTGRWVIAALNADFFGAKNSTSTYRTAIAKAFTDAGVSLVLQGTADAYTRSFPVSGANILSDYPSESTIATKDGVVYLTPGVAGAEQATMSALAVTGTTPWLQRASAFGATGAKTAAENKSFSKITVSQDAISVTATTVGGATLDSFQITRGQTPAREPKQLEPIALTNAFGSDPHTTRSFAWQTDTTLTGAAVQLVPKGKSFDGAQTITAQGTSSAIKQILTSRNSHRVDVTGLLPGTTYTYRLANTSTNKVTGTLYQWYSPSYEFTTESAEAKEFTFLDFADSQGSTGGYASYWGNTVKTALDRVPDAPFIIQNGDMVDAVTSTHLDNWFSATGTELSGPAFYPVLGNHEGTAYNTLYQSLFPIDPQNGYTLNYSFQYGNALFLSLNSNYTSTSDLTKQATWIRDTVRAKGAGKFIIVTFHKAPFGGQHSAEGDVQALKKQIVPVLQEVGADLVLQGHDHNYIRSFPILNSTPNRAFAGNQISSSKDGLVYLLPRNSGEKTYSLTTTSATNKPWINVLWNPGQLNSVPGGDVYVAVTVGADKITVNSYTVSGVLVDSFTVTQ